MWEAKKKDDRKLFLNWVTFWFSSIFETLTFPEKSHLDLKKPKNKRIN